MGRIRLLSDATINRIAAGEVIERPAAAARELVENALDAGATRIRVSIAGGGIDRVEIADDGCGMDADELALAVQRHATSKLTDETLVRISTLGFRGEALPSIGAAAKLTITSRPDGADSAFAISVEGGAVSAVRPAPGGQGTRVDMRDLFFATPARRKFLKSARAESDAVEQAIRRLAVAAPDVAFALEMDGKTAFDLPAQSLAARVAALLGPECVLPIEGVRGEMRVAGFIAPPSVSRASGAGQVLIVNGRPVSDPVLRTAVRVGTRDGMMSGRFPVLALFLTIPPEDVDVNVHPAKAELRYRAADAVRGLVITAVQRALAGGAIAVAPSADGFAASPALPRPPMQLTSWHRPAIGARNTGFSGFNDARLPLDAMPAARPPVATPEPEADHPLGAAVAQVLDTYILAVAADGSLVLVDQHAAHERLTQEALREQRLAGLVRAQAMLIPEVVELPHSSVALLLERADDLASVGVELEGFGPGAVLVRALPAALGHTDAAPLLRDVADELAEQDESTALDSRLDAVIARLACHGSIRAGRRLNQAEMDALLRQMEATPRAATCSHGRPTFLRLTRNELERMFGRKL